MPKLSLDNTREDYDRPIDYARDRKLLLSLALKQAALSHKERTSAEVSVDLKWAYGFAGHPKLFFAQLITGWNDPDWIAWRAFISTVFCEPFATQEEYDIFYECTQLEEPPEQRPGAVWMPIGRRGGKSRVLAAIAVYLACCYDWSHYLDPGELGVVPVLSADRRQARIIMGYVKAFLEHPRLKDRVAAENAESILLEGNILIEVVTASYKAVRGRTVLTALCDEIAFWHSDESSANPDKEIIAALEPAMATIPNALLLGASSPYARRGVLWENFDRYFGKLEGPLVWKAPTWVMHPALEREGEFIQGKYDEDPIAAAAEYGAEFRTDVDVVFSREAIEACIMQGVTEVPPQMGVKYYAFVDPSGGSSDSMSLAIGHIDPATKRGVQDLIRERRPPFSPESVVDEFSNTMREYHITRVTGDHYAGEWPRERFKMRGITYDVSKVRKSDIYLSFVPIVNAARCEMIDESRQKYQLLSLERRIARGGHESVDHPRGGHDDCANVVAGVMTVMLEKPKAIKISPSLMQRAAAMPRLPTLENMSGPRW
jgi:hypothetical protein